MIKLNEEEKESNRENDFIVQFKDVTKIYSGTVALHKINIEVKKGEVHGIIGKNGAGKTTLVGIMSGIIDPTEGEIIIKGKKYRSISRQRAKKEGISIIPQESQVIPDLSVVENIFTPDYIRSWGNFINWKKMYSKIEKVIDESQININPYARAGDLSISEQQLLLVLKACFIDDAQVIIFDEVSSSLTKKDEEVLYRIIREQKKKGKAILFISHSMEEILEICDLVTILRDGKVIAKEECACLDKDKLSYFIVGGEYNYKEHEVGEESGKEEEKESNEIVLSVRNFTKFGAFQNINFDLKKGEVVGLAGLRGSGRTELFKAIAGIDLADKGWIKIGNEEKRFTDPAQALQNGIVYLPEDREKEGLIDILTVRENLTLSSLPRLLNKVRLINLEEEKKLATTLAERLSILTPSIEEELKKLSGGNKQKVLMGKVLSANPIVYLLDEPTKGIDISTKKEILKIIKEELSRFAGIIMSSPGLEDLILICDRILVLYKGEIVGEFFEDKFKEIDLYRAVQGVRDKFVENN